MKVEQKLKIAFIVLIIILISLVSFGGIFVQDTKFVKNIMPNYNLGMDLTGSRLVRLKVSDEVITTYYDKDGKETEEEGKDTTKKEEPVNPKESLTKENYLKSKEIINKRLENLNVSDYKIRLDEGTGDIYLELPENNNTDLNAQYSAIKGNFTVKDDETGEILLTNSNIKNSYCAYNTTTEGTSVYLIIEFNEEGTEILKNITNTYTSYVEDGETKNKQVNLMVDDTTLTSTYFSEEISNGMIQLSIGKATTSGEDFASYAEEASQLAILLDTDALPITYTIDENRYVISDITPNMLFIPVILAVVLIVIGIVFLILRYRKNGILASISYIGYIALYLLILRFTNTVITLEGIVGVVIAVILNYIFTMYLLHLLKHQESSTLAEASSSFKEAVLKALFILIPVTIVSVVLCFVEWVGASSFGMTIFWGILISFIYHLVVTRSLIVATTKK